jgi:hypothetical protein
MRHRAPLDALPLELPGGNDDRGELQVVTGTTTLSPERQSIVA